MRFAARNHFVKSLSTSLLALTCVIGSLSAANATTYYINFDSGSDSALGTNPNIPWKHAPGDPNAINFPAKIKLQPGDNVQFKAGVVYRGSLKLTSDGAAGLPITYDGTGATLSGQDAAQVNFMSYKGSPTVSVANLPFAAHFIDVVTINHEQFYISRYPETSDSLWMDHFVESATFAPLAEMSGSGSSWKLTDIPLSNFLSTLDPAYVNAMAFRNYGQQNSTYTAVISGFDRATHTVSFTGKLFPHTDTTIPAITMENGMPGGKVGFYHLLNHPAFVRSADRFAVSADGHQLFAYTSPGTKLVEVSQRQAAVNFNNHSHIVIQGFNVTGYSGGLGGWGQGTAFVNTGGGVISDITLRNNNIHDLNSWEMQAAVGLNNVTGMTFVNNNIGPTFLGRGMGFNGTNIDIENNTVNKIGRSALMLMNGENVKIVNNRIANLQGMHGDGMAIYDNPDKTGKTPGFNKNVLLANNQFTNCLIPITYESFVPSPATAGAPHPDLAHPNNVTITHNLIVGGNSGITDWGGGNVGTVIAGNIVLMGNPNDANNHSAMISTRPDMRNVTIANNIVDRIGLAGAGSDWTVSNNLITREVKYDASLVSGEAYDLALRPVLISALELGGALPANVCNILAPKTSSRVVIGLDYYCDPIKGSSTGAIIASKSLSVGKLPIAGNVVAITTKK